MYALEHDNIFGYDMKGFTRDNVMYSNSEILQNVPIYIFYASTYQSLLIIYKIFWPLKRAINKPGVLYNVFKSMYIVANRKKYECFLHPAFLYRSLNPSNKNMDVAARNAPITFNVDILMQAWNLT